MAHALPVAFLLYNTIEKDGGATVYIGDGWNKVYTLDPGALLWPTSCLLYRTRLHACPLFPVSTSCVLDRRRRYVLELVPQKRAGPLIVRTNLVIQDYVRPTIASAARSRLMWTHHVERCREREPHGSIS